LGLLKLAHAQRLLPIEQLLSDAGMSSASTPRLPGKPAMVPDVRKAELPSASRPAAVSPFAADSARKGTSKPQMSAENAPVATPRSMGSPTAQVVMGSAAPAAVNETEAVSVQAPQEAIHQVPAPVAEVPTNPAQSNDATPIDNVRGAVLNALSEGGHRMVVAMVETGEWKIEGNEVVIKVATSPTVIEMSLGNDSKRLAIATASGVLGRAMKLKVISGGTAQIVPEKRASSNGGGRSRAEQDPIVRKMEEKFGAKIRTVIDYTKRV
jgi:DNA polymerase III subunit gamma/tau